MSLAMSRLAVRVVLLFLSVSCMALSGLRAEVPPTDRILQTLRKEHPRLILDAKGLRRLRDLIGANDAARTIHESLRASAARILRSPTVEYRIVGPRLLAQSRRCLDRVYTLGLLFRLDGDRKYLERIVKELDAAAAFPDWNPSHFLDTAEMSHAFGIAYDWLFPDLSEAQRERIRTALVQKGLRPYLRGFEKKAWWTRATHNWNQVCHGGVGIAALALAGEDPDLAASILHRALAKLPLALKGYAPDGGWNEGPGYWHYATRYTVYFLAALESALGTDFGLADQAGLADAGRFRIYFEGPTGLSFNYADAGSVVRGTHEMFWLARRYRRPVYAWFQRSHGGRPHALDLVWYSDAGEDPAASGLPLDARFRGVDVCFFRSAWNDPEAVFVGFKGGDNRANHSHLDLGSFVLDADGVRWAVDLGPDDYNLPGYFDTRDRRWTYYRLRNESHNTLVIDGSIQDPRAAAPITEFRSSPGRAHAIADLSRAYPQGEVRRGMALLEREHVLVQDELQLDRAAEVVWGMLTPAEVQTRGQSATLQKDGKRLRARILAPANAHFEWKAAAAPAPQRQQPDIGKLVVRLPEAVRSLRLAVLLSPGEAAAIQPAILPLAEWSRETPDGSGRER